MFEKAARLKVRFPFKGACSVEDLWDLSVEHLDGIYKALKKQQRDSGEESLIERRETAASTMLNLQIDLVKHVFSVKVAEAEERKKASDKKAQKEKILSLIAEKQDEALKGKSVEELTDLVNKL